MANLNLSEFGENTSVSNADYTFVWDSANAISKRVSRNSWLNSGTLTSDAPVTISQTWNAVGQTFTALKVNAAGTSGANSAIGSLLADFQEGGVSKVRVRKDGTIFVPGASNGAQGLSTTANYMSFATALGSINQYGSSLYSTTGLLNLGAFSFNVGTITFDAAGKLDWGDAAIVKDSLNTLALRNGAAAQTFRVYNTYTDASNYERGEFVWSGSTFYVQTINLGTGQTRPISFGGQSMAFRTNSGSGLTERMAITASGNVGIGTTAPTAPLDVVGGIRFNSIAIARSASIAALPNSTTGLYFGYDGTGDRAFFTSGTTNVSGVVSVRKPAIFDYSTFTFTRDGINADVFLNSSGNVGIGTTSPTSKLHVAETWNNAGTAFCAIKSVITDTNSAAGSDFLELYSGTSTQPLRVDINKTGQINIYGAWTDASNYERLSFSAPSAANAVIGTNKAGTGTARGLELQTDGVTRMTLGTTNNVVVKSFEVSDTSPFNDASVALSVNSSIATYLLNFYSNGAYRVAIARATGSIGIATTGKFGWQTAAQETSMRTAFGEYAAGVIEVNNGTAGTFRDLRVRSVVQQLPITTTQTPTLNGDFVVEATSNTTLTFKLKGTDGTVRSGTITLA